MVFEFSSNFLLKVRPYVEEIMKGDLLSKITGFCLQIKKIGFQQKRRNPVCIGSPKYHFIEPIHGGFKETFGCYTLITPFLV
jgi:hypothetical protein